MEFIAYRVANWDTPFWVNENRHARRFNRVLGGPVQYWSLHPLTPWAEVLRGQGIRTEDDLATVSQRLWVARFDIDADLISYDSARDFDLSADDLVSDDHAACQEFSVSRLSDPVPNAVVVPSAALPGTRNLVLFGPLVGIGFQQESLSEEDIPMSPASEHGRPPPSLLPLIRHQSDQHAELEAWKEGESYIFREPPVERM